MLSAIYLASNALWPIDNDNDNEIVYFDINNKKKNIEQKQLLE